MGRSPLCIVVIHLIADIPVYKVGREYGTEDVRLFIKIYFGPFEQRFSLQYQWQHQELW